MNGIRWIDKLKFVGMVWECVDRGPDFYQVKVRIPDGAASYGSGYTLEEALDDAACGMSMDWSSVAREMTDAAWAEIAHC